MTYATSWAKMSEKKTRLSPCLPIIDGSSLWAKPLASDDTVATRSDLPADAFEWGIVVGGKGTGKAVAKTDSPKVPQSY